MRISRWTALVIIILGLVVIGGTAVILSQSSHTFSGILPDTPTPAPDFTLTDETGTPFTLGNLRGQWILLAYGYTSCPDVCPTTLAQLRGVKVGLGPDADKVRVVFVSVDPERDTPDILQRYLAHFGADFKGLSGTAAEVAAAAEPYGVRYEKSAETGSAAGYQMSHTAYVYLIDPEFNLRVTFPFGVGSDEILSDLTYLMND
ncbi:MAG: SCO family protein [Anaerolineae bacterium]|nr:SCO family protein [Anaerolineae bacterium]